MSFFPSDYDPTEAVVAVLDMAEVDTPDGVFRFIIGTDGIFTDINSNEWVGSQLLSVAPMELPINGIAPEGSITLSFFQDPNAESLIEKIKELGKDYIDGRTITFYVQPIRSQAEFMAPTTAPLKWATRTMRQIKFSAAGAQDRSIVLSFEGAMENRKTSRRIILNTVGHAALIGEANISLSLMPTVQQDDEKLFG